MHRSRFGHRETPGFRDAHLSYADQRANLQELPRPYELHADSRAVAEAATVPAAYDSEDDAPVTIPDQWRRRLTA